jgi:hypothetical protein
MCDSWDFWFRNIFSGFYSAKLIRVVMSIRCSYLLIY